MQATSSALLRRFKSLLLTLMLLAPILALAPVARADGGAPNLAYVAGTSQGITVIDIGQQKVSSTIATGGQPHMILLSPDARFLYVAEPQQNQLLIFSAKTGDKVCSASVSGQPSLLNLDTSTTNTIYVAGSGSSTVTAVDTTTCALKHTYQASGPVQGLFVAAVGTGAAGNGNQLWVAAGDAIAIFDTQSTHQIGSVAIPDGPQYISIPQGSTVYVTTKQGSVDAVDLSTHSVTRLISGGSYGPMDYNAITGEIYVPDEKNKSLMVLTPTIAGTTLPHEPAHVFSFGVAPVSVAITSDGQLGFVALQGGNVAMIDIPARQVINTFVVGGNPQFIITGQYPPLLGTNPQQANTLGTIFNIAAYVLVIALFIVPIVLFRRYSRARTSSAGPDKRPPPEESEVEIGSQQSKE